VTRTERALAAVIIRVIQFNLKSPPRLAPPGPGSLRPSPRLRLAVCKTSWSHWHYDTRKLQEFPGPAAVTVAGSPLAGGPAPPRPAAAVTVTSVDRDSHGSGPGSAAGTDDGDSGSDSESLAVVTRAVGETKQIPPVTGGPPAGDTGTRPCQPSTEAQSLGHRHGDCRCISKSGYDYLIIIGII
jgi:hypothetical protein